MLSDGIYCDVSRAEIERYLSKDGTFDREFEIPVDDGDGEVVVIVRVVVQRGGGGVETTSIALLVHNTRVACIDFEARFKDIDGKQARGWHKHEWDPRERTADYRKIPLDGFGPFDSASEFLIRAAEELKVSFSGKDYGDPELPFD